MRLGHAKHCVFTQPVRITLAVLGCFDDTSSELLTCRPHCAVGTILDAAPLQTVPAAIKSGD
jgi:hypothetical protein